MNYSTLKDLLSFLEMMKKEGLMNPATVSARKAACNKIFSKSNSEDAKNVLGADIDELANLLKGDVEATTLETYKNRVKSSIDELSRWKKSPENYKSEVASRTRLSQEKVKQNLNAQASLVEIPIRLDLTISIKGLPFDLTEEEANKISDVIAAMASKSEGE